VVLADATTVTAKLTSCQVVAISLVNVDEARCVSLLDQGYHREQLVLPESL
jgi:hypothetical protein